MTINKLNGTECGTEIAKKINTIIDEKASVSLDNLDATGQAIIDGKVSSSDLFDENEHIKINKLQSYSLPVNKGINLSLGASGSIYTAPADGWYFLDLQRSSGNYCMVSSLGPNIISFCNSSTYNPRILHPVTKGTKVKIEYNTSSDGIFMFVYSRGSAPQS